MTTALEQILNTSFLLKTLELLRKRNHDLLMNTHIAKNIQWTRFQVSLRPLYTNT